jgi:hypothetical protein
MSEDRLDRALEEMKQEAVDDRILETARERVWSQIAGVAGSTCAEFRPDFRAYLTGTLGNSRRVLMDDHLSRCAACRTSLAELKGERQVMAMPQRSAPRWRRTAMLAAAAALVLMVGYAGRGTLDALMAPSGPRATVASVEGDLYRLSGEMLAADATIAEGELVRTGAGAHAVLRLADGSTIDVNERTELFTTAVWSGVSIHLKRGDVIVQAADQRRGHLRVLTRDSIVSVKGTVFAVSAGLGGSVVSVVEGSVAVSQPGTDVLLRPGQQLASNPALASSVENAVAWSPDAEQYLALLASFGTIDRQLAERLPLEQRTNSSVLPYLPAEAFAYGAIPNVGGRLSVALNLAEQQSTENASFGAWWNSETGQTLRQMLYHLQSVSGMLGDEVAFCASTAGSEQVPMVIARVLPGQRAALVSALDGLFAQAGEAALPYSVSDDLLVVSATPAHLTWALGHLGQGAGSPFAAAIAERYRRGAFSMMGVDASALVALAGNDDAPPVELAAMMGTKYVFFEQRAPAGAEENEVTLLFDGERKGMAAWLADAGSGGAADYLPVDALLAGYVSVQQPSTLFQEFVALMTRTGEDAEGELAEVEGRLGSGFTANLTAALGSEAAFAVNGLSVGGPRWLMTALAYNPPVIDSSVQRLVEVVNSELSTEEGAEAQRAVFTQEDAGGRVWNSVTTTGLPFGLTWTYDGGYMVAASDRATAERAIATRNGGSALVWSHEFRSQLPASNGLHPSAFVWLNTKGALGALATLAPNPAAASLLAERDPVLVVFDVKPNQIHGASRTRLSRVILDLMALESLGGTREGQSSGAVTQ